MPGHLVLKGDRVSLWTVTKDDLKKIWNLLDDKDIRLQNFHPSLIVYPEDLESVYQKLLESKDFIWFLIVENRENNIVGIVELKIKGSVVRKGYLSYFVGKQFRNQGYATEAVKLVLEYAFEMLNLDKVYAEVDEDNIASIRVLENNGFKYVGRLRKHYYSPKHGKVDVLFYDILKEEYNNKLQ